MDSGQLLGTFFSVAVEAADLDRDGDLDLFFGNAGGGQPNQVWLKDDNYVLCGDCDLDGDIDVLDALRAARLAAVLIMPGPLDFRVCDVDADADIDIIDALLTAQAAAGLPVMLTCP